MRDPRIDRSASVSTFPRAVFTAAIPLQLHTYIGYIHKNFIKMMTNRAIVTIQYILKYYDIQH